MDGYAGGDNYLWRIGVAFDKMNFMIFFRDKMKKVIVSRKVILTVFSFIFMLLLHFYSILPNVVEEETASKIDRWNGCA